jgi:hypothetical protein
MPNYKAHPLPTKWSIFDLPPPRSATFGRDRNDDILVSSRSRTETIIVKGRPLWTCELTWDRIEWRDASVIRQVVEALRGSRNAIQIRDFTRDTPLGTALALGGRKTSKTAVPWVKSTAPVPFSYAGNNNIPWVAAATPPKVSIAAAAGAYSVTMSGWQESAYVGRNSDYIQIDNRLYMLAGDMITNAAGVGTATLMTPLIKAAPVGTVCVIEEASCEMRLVDPKQSWSRSAGEAFTSFSLNFIETVRDF